ncbi:hypothetical protein [Lysobacter capsici]|uniref:hypothetical protein n=1 Tax=Lysobacter capsici TaxID=435897 RepID=UPI001C00063E|nr:hypothetical protein [Lysobacter capsici]QWF18782.1 hypothetical protein KME82_08600 [Lysobacter capsici]
MHAVRLRDMDVPSGACLRKLRTCGHLIQRKAFFFGYLLTEGNPDGLLSLLTKESNSAACGRKPLILPSASKALKPLKLPAGSKASATKAAGNFLLSRATKESHQRKRRSCFESRAARSVLTQACATRDILSRWRTAHIHVRRPPGVLLLTRGSGFAALDELRGFGLKPKPCFNSNSNGKHPIRAIVAAPPSDRYGFNVNV